MTSSKAAAAAPRAGDDSPRAAATRRLTAAGLRLTQARLNVMQALVQLPRAISHGELAQQLRPRGMDRATVYRNLVDLVGAGALLRVRFADAVWRYQLPDGPGDAGHAHPHFVCTRCDKIVCLAQAGWLLEAPYQGLRVREVHLLGECAECAAALAREA